MKKFAVTMSYTFECTWEIKAKNEEEAIEYATKHCGCVWPDYHSSLGEDSVDTWEGDVHPEKTFISGA